MDGSITLTTRDYRPGNYSITFNFTDIYGQTAQKYFSGIILHGTVISSLAQFNHSNDVDVVVLKIILQSLNCIFSDVSL